MTTVIQTQAIDTGILDQAEIALADGVSKTGDLIQGYANALSQVFDRRDTEGNIIAKWFTLEGAERKGIKARRASFVQRMMQNPKFVKTIKADGTKVPTATVDTYWSRVKEASGYVPSGRVTGANDVDAKTAAELKTMINRIYKADEDGIECNAADFLVNLKDVFEGMGGDVMDLGKNLK